MEERKGRERERRYFAGWKERGKGEERGRGGREEDVYAGGRENVGIMGKECDR